MTASLCLLLLLGSTAQATEAIEAKLRSKARTFRNLLIERHLSREGVVLYRVNLETIARDQVRGSYPLVADTPTFTGLLAATSCTRAAVEHDADRMQARGDARHALAGLRFLMDVTGVPGLLARTIRRNASDDLDHLPGRWFHGARGYEDYIWRGDTSMDQYTNGLLPALAACAEAFPERTRKLVVDVASHLLAHRMHLVDPDGTPTRFGDLSRHAGFGFNSIAQLTGYGIFALAAVLDLDPRWKVQRDRLRDRDRVVARSRVTNVRFLRLTKFSNELMAWNLYRVLMPLTRRTNDPARVDLRHGMHRSWQRVRSDQNPYFTLIWCRNEPDRCDEQQLEEVRNLLEHFPLDKRLHPPPRAVARLARYWLPDRKGRPQARDPVPIELRSPGSFEWMSSPYRISGDAAPTWSYSGLDYLAAYWLYRTLPQPQVQHPQH